MGEYENISGLSLKGTCFLAAVGMEVNDKMFLCSLCSKNS